MSHASLSSAPSRRDISNILKRTTGALTGGRRGPDQGEGVRVPRRNSYDEQDPRAKPWARIGDGSVGEGLAHRDALVDAAEEHFRQGRKETPAARIREVRAMRAALAAELDGGGLPAGRPASIRLELAKLDEILERGSLLLQRTDVTVLRALLKHLDFKTGRLFPAIVKIAEQAGCHRNSVVAALRRLKHHGFIDWVRRSTRTGNEGEFAPQREQTSNAYFFDHRRRMAPRTWSRFAQLLTARLRRLGNAAVRALAPGDPPPIAGIQSSELREALARVDAKLANANT